MNCPRIKHNKTKMLQLINLLLIIQILSGTQRLEKPDMLCHLFIFGSNTLRERLKNFMKKDYTFPGNDRIEKSVLVINQNNISNGYYQV